MTSNNNNIISLKIKNVRSELTKSDKKIIKALQNDPEVFVHSPIKKIAQYSNTSVAAITRFTKKIDFKSLNEFKIALSTELDYFKNTIEDNFDVSNDDTISVLINKIFDGNVNVIQETKKIVR